LQEPVLFLKPTSSFLHAGPTAGPIEVPEPLESLHHEVELAVVISRRARDVPEASAMDFVGGNYEARLWDAVPARLPLLRFVI
jgi:acylpyruvate hydrolase